MSGMILHKLKVLNAIVGAVAIKVMHPLLVGKASAKPLLHDKAVLENRDAVYLERHIPFLRYGARALLATVLAFGLFLHEVSIAHLDHNTVLPGVPTKVMKRAMERGYLTYRLDDAAAAYPGFRLQAAQVALAGYEGLGIEAVEVVSGTPDIYLTMPDDAKFIEVCKQGAAGCILYWADPVMIYFRRALLYADWKTTIAHEGINYGHAMGEHEQYYDSNGQFQCKTSATYTVMSCGTGVWRPQQYDLDVVRSLMVPQPFSGFYGMSYSPGSAIGYWCGGDVSGRATRVAIMAIAPDGTPYFSGVHLPIVAGCYSTPIVGEPGWCFSVLAENSFSWRVPAQRFEAYLGCL